MINLKRVAIVVGEHSGDILGADLIKALKRRFPDCLFEGIGGERMESEGFQSLFPLERLAVMGFVDPLKRLPELLSIRKILKQRYLSNPPDLFIGIDSPDFNLHLENFLKHKAQIPVVHYVSPSVWAWRQGRIKTIARSTDLMLTLFPFEAQFYSQHGVRNCCVGHPLADTLPVKPDTVSAKKALGLTLSDDALVIGVLPGSRKGEVEQLCERFLRAAKLLHKQKPNAVFVIPAASEARKTQIELLVKPYHSLPVTVTLGNSHHVMAASEAIMIASGTATLEALLLKKPMVIAYHMSNWSYWLLNKLVKSKFIGLPNILAEKELVPELIQKKATPENICQHLLGFLTNDLQRSDLVAEFTSIHISLKKNASETATGSIIDMLSERRDLNKKSNACD